MFEMSDKTNDLLQLSDEAYMDYVMYHYESPTYLVVSEDMIDENEIPRVIRGFDVLIVSNRKGLVIFV